jgi:type IV pilus assembly protein PilM
VLFGSLSTSIGVVGVEFGEDATRLLQVRTVSGRLHVLGAGRIDMPIGPETCADGLDLTERIRAAMGSGGFAGRRCVVCLPRTLVQVHAVRLPRMPDADMAQAVAWEAAQRFNIDRSRLSADFIRTGMPGKAGDQREEVLMISVAHDAIDPWVEPLLEAGLRPVAIETHFTALARLFSQHYRREADRDNSRVVLDIGDSGATLLILRGDAIAFCKSIGIGAAHLDRAVADHLQMDKTAAAELRAARLAAAASLVMRRPSGETATSSGANHGGESGRRHEEQDDQDAATDRAVFEAVRPLIGELAREVGLCLRYFGVTFRGAPPERLILTGMAALEPHLAQSLARAMDLPVAVDDQTGTLTTLNREIRSVLNREPGVMSSWAVAAGLSMRGLARSRVERRRRDDAQNQAREAA